MRKITRRSGFCRMKAWCSSWMRGTTMWLPFTRRTDAESLILSASSSTCLTQGPAAFTIAQARIVHPAVVIGEAALELGLQARPVAVQGEPHALRSRQRAPRAEAEQAVPEMIVEEQPGADHPRRPQVRLVGKHELHRPDDVRRDPEQRLALGERLGDEPEFEVLEIPQAAVDKLGRGRRSPRGEIVLLGEQHLQAAPRGVARDARAVDAAADDEKVVAIHA